MTLLKTKWTTLSLLKIVNDRFEALPKFNYFLSNFTLISSSFHSTFRPSLPLLLLSTCSCALLLLRSFLRRCSSCLVIVFHSHAFSVAALPPRSSSTKQLHRRQLRPSSSSSSVILQHSAAAAAAGDSSANAGSLSAAQAQQHHFNKHLPHSLTRSLISVMVGISLGEQHFIQGGIAQDLRCDGRKRLTYRPICVETGVIPQANGSARVRMGATDVIASVKAELGKPTLLRPDKGKVFIHVDCSSTAEPAFEGRGGDELSAELSTALQSCLLGGKSGEGAGIDLSSLIVIEGKICWDLYIDGLVVSSDGNLLDALGVAIKAALSNTGIPRVQVAAGASTDEQPEVDISDEEFLQFDTSGIPVIVTLTKVGRHYIVDATSEEESQMSSAVSISLNRQGHICGVTKRGGAGLDPSIILDMVSVAKHVSEQLINKLDAQIASAEAEDES